jgi:hypothetical protein
MALQNIPTLSAGVTRKRSISMDKISEARITLRLPAGIVEALDERAAALGVSRSVVARWHLEPLITVPPSPGASSNPSSPLET